MKKFFYDKRIVFVYIITILIILIGTTYALSSASSSLGLTTALIGIDGDAYGSPTFDSSNLDFKPILDTKVEESTDNVIKIDFSVGGAESNNNDNIIYDIALNGLDINCNLLSPYIKWKLLKEGTEVSSGSLDYKFDTIDEDGRLVLTTIQEDLPDYNENDKSTYDDYTFYMWFSDSCQSEDISKCKSAVDQSNLIGQNIEGKIEVELYTEGKKQLVRNPENVLSSSKCTGAYIATLNTNGGVLASGVESSIKVISGSNWDPTSLPEPSRTDTVIFNTNGGSDITTVSNVINNFEIENTINTFSNIPKIKLMENSNNLIEIPYDFVGWYLDKNLTIPVTSDTKVSSKNQKLYAKWIGDNTITLPSITKENNTFLGWFIDSSLKNKVGNAGDSYQVLKNTNFYAGWKVNYIQINLDDNEGTGGMGTIYVVPGEGFFSDMELTNPITTVTVPTKIGHTFSGYSGLTDASGNITASSDSISEISTFTAGWSINSYNVKFIANQFNPVSTQTVDGITASFDSTTSYLTLNGTNTSTRISFQLIDCGAFTVGDKYELSVTYISGSYSGSVDSSISTEVVTSSNSNLSERVYTDRSLPFSGELTNTLTITELASTSGRYLNTHIWIASNNGLTFSNYKIKVVIRKVEDKQLQYNSRLEEMPIPTKRGYTFDGWYTGENGTGIQATTSTTVPANDISYYAKWTTNVITVVYNSNGGTGSMNNSSYEYDGLVTLTKNAFTKTGYTFSGWRINNGNKWYGCTSGDSCWSTNSTLGWYDSPALYYTASDEMSFGGLHTSEGTVTLYAQWTANNYYIDLNWNLEGNNWSSTGTTAACANLVIGGVDKGCVADYYTQHPHGTTYQITSIKLNGTTVSYSYSGTVNGAALSHSIALNTLTISRNDTSYGTITASTLYVKKGTTYTTSVVDVNNGKITLNDGRTVTATATGATGYTTKFSSWSSASGTINAATTITANFSRTANTYTVTLNNQSATTAGSTSVTATYNSNMPAITKPSRAYTVTYNANSGSVSPTSATATYTFGGYYTSTSGGGTQYYTAAGASARTWNLTSNTTLYAKWTSASVTLPTPTRVGYTFNGWYTAASGGTKVGAAGAAYTPTANITVYAQWTMTSYGVSSPATGVNTLQEAISVANAGATITLQKSITDPSSVTFSKNLTFDNGGYTLKRNTTMKINSGVTVTMKGSGVIEGTALITDTALINNAGTLDIQAGGYASQSSTRTIYNSGTFTLTNGNILNVGTCDAKKECNGITVASAAVNTKILKGKVYSKVGTAVRILELGDKITLGLSTTTYSKTEVILYGAYSSVFGPGGTEGSRAQIVWYNGSMFSADGEFVTANIDEKPKRSCNISTNIESTRRKTRSLPALTVGSYTVPASSKTYQVWLSKSASNSAVCTNAA